ncbi:sensor histidine kinase [Arthrobacter sp. YD4]|uniref:ATP-binding protein n=1 Tax=Arthrobacter sp. YD4 TaxID=3058043 RepID=UPI0025B62372|nr:sensor histidine kinase [Arthrobacter sp. YD4]MDN3937332.1 sensor histidine kinase [Arthrobacter sp. YD4]
MFHSVPLRFQLVALQLAIVLAVLTAVGVVTIRMQEAQLRDAYKSRLIGVAESVARLPSVINAFGTPAPAETIQPIAEVIRQASNVTYVVVTDKFGVRQSHPNPEEIGKHVSTDPSVPLAGDIYVGTQTGTLGESWRVKVPIFDRNGAVIGSASVGVLESTLAADLYEDLPQLFGWLVGAALLGSLGAMYISKLVWRRIYKLEPEDIAALLETRDAMLHGLGEGLVAVDADGTVVLVNDEARRLLGVGEEILGSPATASLEPGIHRLLAAGSSTEELVLSGERILLGKVNAATVDGREVGKVLILRDRTELHAMLRDRDGALDVTQALRAQAHEFANKLHVVSGLLELGQQSKAVEFLGRSAADAGFVNRPLAAGITDDGVRALLIAKSTVCAERGIDIEVAEDSVCSPDGTDDVITVLGNLIDNAVDAAGYDSTVAVALTETPAGGRVLTVEDDGPGVPEAARQAVFDPGVTSKDTDGVNTRGFGLALVQRVARRRGGTAAVTRSDLGGARFTVTFSTLTSHTVISDTVTSHTAGSAAAAPPAAGPDAPRKAALERL